VRPPVVENHVIKITGLVDRTGSGSNFNLRTGRRDYVIADMGMRKLALCKQRSPIRRISYSQLALTLRLLMSYIYIYIYIYIYDISSLRVNATRIMAELTVFLFAPVVVSLRLNAGYNRDICFVVYLLNPSAFKLCLID